MPFVCPGYRRLSGHPESDYSAVQCERCYALRCSACIESHRKECKADQSFPRCAGKKRWEAHPTRNAAPRQCTKCNALRCEDCIEHHLAHCIGEVPGFTCPATLHWSEHPEKSGEKAICSKCDALRCSECIAHHEGQCPAVPVASKSAVMNAPFGTSPPILGTVVFSRDAVENSSPNCPGMLRWPEHPSSLYPPKQCEECGALRCEACIDRHSAHHHH